MVEQETNAPSVEATAYDVFISVAAMASIAVVGWLFMVDPKSEEAKLLNYFDYFFCFIFFLDYLRQLARAKHRLRYIFGWGLLDLGSSIPVFGPLRMLRVARLIRVLGALRSIRILLQVFRSDYIGSAIVSSMTTSMGGIIMACFGVLHYESQAAGATIKTADDVIWWAIVTTSTVGYGDYYPVTAPGKVLAAMVMILGIGLFATLAGALASRLTAISRPENTRSIHDRIHDLQQQNHELLKKLESHLKS